LSTGKFLQGLGPNQRHGARPRGTKSRPGGAASHVASSFVGTSSPRTAFRFLVAVLGGCGRRKDRLADGDLAAWRRLGMVQPGCRVLAAWSLRVGRVTRRQVFLAPDLPPQPLTGGGTILLVEHRSEAASDVLTSLVYRVLMGSNAEDALQRRTARPGIHLLLTGVVLPTISGPQLTQLVQSSRPSMKVLTLRDSDKLGAESGSHRCRILIPAQAFHSRWPCR
jgi:hypothetical protein